MIIIESRVAAPLLNRVMSVLGMSTADLAEHMGVSTRTIQRWTAGNGSPQATEVLALAREVHPRDATLAAELAAACHETLESLALEKPKPAAEAATPPTPAHLTPFLVEAVVCAVADVVGGVPASVRPMVQAAFERALAAGLSVEDVVGALRGPKAEEKADAPKAAKTGRAKGAGG
jgi:hypothetical protein